MYNILSLSRIFIYIISIALLISSIVTKNKKVCKTNIIISICFVVYLFFSIIMLPGFLGVATGLETLIYLFVAAIDSIILIVEVIINLVKLKKKELGENKYNKCYGIVLVSIPLIMVIVSFLYELNFLNKCELVLNFEYQNGIVISDITKIAVGKDFCKEINISERFKNKEARNLEHYTYDIEENENGEIIITSDYDDPNLMKINTEIVKQIYLNDSYTKSETALKLYQDEPNVIYKGIVTKIGDTDYYIVEYLISNKTGGVGTVLGSAIFYDTKFISDLDVVGDIDTIYSYID